MGETSSAITHLRVVWHHFLEMCTDEYLEKALQTQNTRCLDAFVGSEKGFGLQLGYAGTGLCSDWAAFLYAWRRHRALFLAMSQAMWRLRVLSEMTAPWPQGYINVESLRDDFAYKNDVSWSTAASFFTCKKTRNSVQWLLCPPPDVPTKDAKPFHLLHLYNDACEKTKCIEAMR